MPTVVGRSLEAATGLKIDRGPIVTRELNAAYARERIEEVIRAVAEDALSPSPLDTPPWRDELRFEGELLAAVREVAETADRLLAERLIELVETAPPRLAGRLGSVPRFSDLS